MTVNAQKTPGWIFQVKATHNSHEFNFATLETTDIFPRLISDEQVNENGSGMIWYKLKHRMSDIANESKLKSLIKTV